MKLTDSKMDHISHLFAQAMENDPLNVYFIPRLEHRRRVLPRLYYTLLAFNPAALRENGAAAALVEIPGSRGGAGDILAGIAGGLGLLWTAGPLALARMVRYQRFAARLRRARCPAGHVYVELLSTLPGEQGKGLAAGLLETVFLWADDRGLPVCLETQNERNVPFYEKRGFSTVVQTHVPGTGLGHWLMARPVRTR